MSEPVWVSNALMSTELLQSYNTDVMHKIRNAPPNQYADLFKEFKLLTSSYMRGENIINSELLSENVTLNRIYNDADPHPHFFTNSFAFISPELRALLEQFDLGKTAFKEVTLVNPFAETRHEGHSILNVCEVRDAVDVEKSEGLAPMSFTTNFTMMETKDDEIVLRQRDVGGSDLWMDLTVFGAYFISDRLHSALQAANLFQRPKFMRCRMG